MDKIFTEAAERLNGRLAMIGFVAAVGAYLTTGQIIPGIFWVLENQHTFEISLNDS